MLEKNVKQSSNAIHFNSENLDFIPELIKNNEKPKV